jgi:hypothetical protein
MLDEEKRAIETRYLNKVFISTARTSVVFIMFAVVRGMLIFLSHRFVIFTLQRGQYHLDWPAFFY